MKRSKNNLKIMHEADANFIIKNEDGSIYVKVVDGKIEYASPDSGYKKGYILYETE
jgi:hypothetical protein